MTGKIKLNAGSGGGSVSFQAPSSTGDDRVITLPTTADGTVLTTTNPKAGILFKLCRQLKQTLFSTNTLATEEDITGMSATITPSASTSKILITASLNYGGIANNYAGIILKDNSSEVMIILLEQML